MKQISATDKKNKKKVYYSTVKGKKKTLLDSIVISETKRLKNYLESGIRMPSEGSNY